MLNLLTFFRRQLGRTLRRHAARRTLAIEPLECRRMMTAELTSGFQQVSGDFDGDSYGDLFYWDAQTGNNTIALGSGLTRDNQEFGTGSDHVDPAEVRGGVYTNYVAGDFDGNGKDDLFFWNSVTGENRTYYSWDTFSRNTNEIDPRGLNGGDYLEVVAADFDGDHRVDLFFWNSQTGANKLAFANGIYNGSRSWATLDERIDHNWLSSGRYHTGVGGDFDNDGREDLFFWNASSGENRTYFAYGAYNGVLTFAYNSNEVEATGINGGEYSRLVAGDFEGDRRVDLFFWNEVTGNNRLAYANGYYNGERRFDVVMSVIDPRGLNGQEFDQMSAGDFDGDHRDDVTFYHPMTGNNQTAFAYGHYNGIYQFQREFHYVDPAEVDGFDQRRLRPGANPVHVGWDNEVLYLRGTDASNVITIGATKGGIYVDGGDQLPPANYDVQRIEVWLEGGDDFVINTTNIPMIVRGGAGNDTLVGGGGNDFLDGGEGHDYLNGGEGVDDATNGEEVINCEPFEQRLAYRWAPVLLQDVDTTGGILGAFDHSAGGRSDYITGINYDGDWDTRNNWDNIENGNVDLSAQAYYSVVATESHWYIIYGFYHPRDWADDPLSQLVEEHENDMEGMLAIVKRGTFNGEDLGELQAIVTLSHHDFTSYIADGSNLQPAPDADPLGQGEPMDYGGVLPGWPRDDGVIRTALYADAHGHGIKALKANPNGSHPGNDGGAPASNDTTYLLYEPTLGAGGVPSSPQQSTDDWRSGAVQTTPYRLVNIFEAGGLWDHRFDRLTFGRWGKFFGDNGSDNAANAPWTWDDTTFSLSGAEDDGRVAGEIAFDPAAFANAWFRNESFSQNYESNPYRADNTAIFLVNGVASEIAFGEAQPWEHSLNAGDPLGDPQDGLTTLVDPREIHLANWDNFFAHGNASFVSGEGDFVEDMRNYLNLMEDSDTVILVGYSYGGDSVLEVANSTTRNIDLLITLDPVGSGGFRANLPNVVPSNVTYFLNRWQEEAPFPNEVLVPGNPSALRENHATRSLNSDFGIADQARILGVNVDHTTVPYDAEAVVFTAISAVVGSPPVALADSYGIREDTLLFAGANVLANDSDPDGAPLTAILVTGVSHGTLSLSGIGAFSYTPSRNFFGTDSFTYKATDGALQSSVVTVTITVTPVNDRPSAAADDFRTDEDVPLTVPGLGVLQNDSDADGDALSAVFVSGASHGTLAFNADGSFRYTPDADYFGTDSFMYKATDGTFESDAVAVTITVTPVNERPTAAADAFRTDEDIPLTVPGLGVLQNDSDADGDALSAVLVSGVSHGTLALNADGSFRYTPDADYSGTDSFTYKATDGTLESGVVTVTITVTTVNERPDAAANAFRTDEDVPLTVPGPGVLQNDSDADGDGLSAVLVSSVSHGTLALNADGSFRYTPDADYFGTDSFTYKATDGRLESGAVTVTIAVAAINDRPTAAADAFRTDEDVALTVPGLGVLQNDSDADGDALSAVLVSGASHGTLALNADGSFRYTPDTNYFGTDSFVYRVSDGVLSGNPTIVTLEVVPVDDPPVLISFNGATGDLVVSFVEAADVSLRRADDGRVRLLVNGHPDLFVSSANDVRSIRIDGSTGNDRVDLRGVASVGFPNLRRVTVSGSEGNDALIGAANLAASLLGGAGDDSLIGGSGNDTLDGGAGNDILSGGEGSDSLNGGTGNDQIREAGVSRISLTNTSMTGRGTDRFARIESAWFEGTNLNDTLNGSSFTGPIFIDGRGGNDSLTGGIGNDTLLGGGGIDRLNGLAGNDLIRGQAGNDRILGGAGNDALDGGDGNDTLNGEAGNDTMLGGEGNDSLLGGAGNDSMGGQAGRDTLKGEAGRDLLFGGIGNDSLSGGAGNDTLLGEDGRDTLKGEAGTDVLCDPLDMSLSDGTGAERVNAFALNFNAIFQQLLRL